MAILKTTCWYQRAGGAEANGGGYDGTGYPGGTNYADQDAYQLALTDLTSTASTTATSATGGFTAAMVGNCLRLASGTGATPGYYFITAYTDTNTITLDRASGTYTAGVGKIGGAHASLGQYSTGGLAGAAAITSPLAAGHYVYIRGSGTDNSSVADFDYSSNANNYWTWPSGDLTNGYIRIVGYNGRPVIKFPGLTVYSGNYRSAENLKFIYTGASYSISALNVTDAKNCYYDLNGLDVVAQQATNILNCWFYNNGSTAAGTNAAVQIMPYGGLVSNCLFEKCRGPAIYTTDMGRVENNIIINGSSHGVVMNATNTQWNCSCVGNTIYNNLGDGVNASGYPYNQIIYNNIIANNGGYGVKFPSGLAFNDLHITFCNYNNLYNNTSGPRLNISAGSGDVSLDPQFTNAAGLDFSVGTNMKAKGYPVAIVKSNTTSYKDLGVAQRQEVAGGSTIYVNRQDINMIPPWSIGM